MSRTAILLFAALASTAALGAAELRAGTARIEITDLAPPLVPPSGKYAHEHLFIRAIVLESGFARAALLGVDRADMDKPIYRQASKTIAEELNCPVDNLLFTATHSHSAFMPTFGPQGPEIKGDPEVVAARMLAAVRQAKAALKPARIGYGSGRSYLNVNRDNIDPETHLWTQMPNLDAPSDKTVGVLKIESLDGALIAAYFTYAMHPVNGYVTNITSADFAGAASRYVEQAYGDKTVAIFVQGASGDQNPIYLRAATNVLAARIGAPIPGNVLAREPIEAQVRTPKAPLRDASPQTIDTLERVIDAEGVLLGEEVIRVISNTKRLDAAVSIDGSQSVITCPGRKRLDAAREGTPGRYEDGDPVHITLGLIRVGDIAITSVNGEVYSAIGMKLRAASPLANTLFVTNANGRANSGYIPNDTAFGANTFQVIGSRLKPGCAEDAIVNGLLDLIQATGN